MTKALLTGATGYVGKNLLPLLVKNNIEVIAISRDKNKVFLPEALASHVNVYEGDLLEKKSLENLPQDIDVAYYLVHSMTDRPNFYPLEERSARNFVEAAKKAKVKQIIFLSGIMNQPAQSPHLKSRKNVENILKESGIPTTIFRAAIIIGSGSSSFEIMRDLIEKLPVMTPPLWVTKLCQPIGIRDVLFYLKESLLNESCFHRTFDIGSQEKKTFQDLLYLLAKKRKLKRKIFVIPVITPRLSSYWLVFVTSTKFNLATSIVESMKNDFIVENQDIESILPHQTLTIDEMYNECFEDFEQTPFLEKEEIKNPTKEVCAFLKLPYYGCYQQKFIKKTQLENTDFWKRAQSVLSKDDWSFLFRLRKKFSPHQQSDWDVWTVLLQEDSRVILRAEVTIPGTVYLQLEKVQEEVTLKLSLRPRGVIGRFYWWFFYPFHTLVYKNLIKKLCSS